MLVKRVLRVSRTWSGSWSLEGIKNESHWVPLDIDHPRSLDQKHILTNADQSRPTLTNYLTILLRVYQSRILYVANMSGVFNSKQKDHLHLLHEISQLNLPSFHEDVNTYATSKTSRIYRIIWKLGHRFISMIWGGPFASAFIAMSMHKRMWSAQKQVRFWSGLVGRV